MGIKKLLTVAALLAAGGLTHSAWAQTDVTKQYIKNPSFELASEDTNLSSCISISNTGTVNDIYGWVSYTADGGSFNNHQINDANTDNASAFGKKVTPTDGSYSYFFRKGWNSSTGNEWYIVQSEAMSLPAGKYLLTADWMGAESKDNDHPSYGSSLTLQVLDGEEIIANSTENTTFDLNQGSNYFTTYGYWKKIGVLLDLETATSVKAKLTATMKGGVRSDICIDNIKLIQLSEVSVENTWDLTSLVGESKSAWINSSEFGIINDVLRISRYSDQHFTGNVMNQTINGLPKGYYNVEFYCNANCASWSCSPIPEANGATDRTIFSANTKEVGIPVLNDGKSLTEFTNYTLNDVAVTDGSLTLSIRNDQEGANWISAQIKSLTYIREFTEEEKISQNKPLWTEAFNTAQSTIADGTYTNVIGTEKTALQAEIDKAEPTTAEGYTEATTALTTATAAFTAAVTNYDNLVAEIAKAKALGIEEATANSYAATVTSTSATVLASTQDLKVDEYEYVTENYAYGVALGEWVSEATGTKAADFSNEHWSGTTHSYKNQDDSNNQGWHANSWSINFNQDVELPAGDYVFKVAARQESGDQVNTTIIVKNGETTLGSASDFPRSNNSRGINKEGATSFDPEDPAGFANNGNGFGWEWRFVKFTLAEEATVNIAINSVATASHQWVSFGDYTLQTNNEANIATIAYNIVLRDAEAAFNNDTYSAIQGTTRAELETAINAEPGATVDEIEASTETLKEKTQALIDTYNAKVAMDNALTAVKALNITTNVGTGAFQIPASAATAVTAAITSAEELTDEAVKADYEAATTALNNAKDTFNNAELNAPEAGKLYSIINNSDGYEFKGKAVTFKSASNADLAGNTTSMGYTELPGSAYPQGITFTAVPETLNGYILSYTREDGNTVYVGTGTSTGLGTDNNQIRPTTDPAKAVTIQIIPTATEGIWNLKNIPANKNIGANNDSGFYTANKNTSLTLAEVTPLTVTVSNDAAESKFKTLILPFDAELPEGVTAYSCEEVVNSVLNTVASPSIEANTPYILSVEAGKSVEFTGVGGAYTDASYTAGYLTGGYTTGTVPTGSYVLQTQEGVQGFYKVAETAVDYVPYRAYLTVPSANAKAFFFGGDATAINGVEGAEGATEVVRFNAAGVQVAAPVKGLNIVKMSDGTVKKVMVK